MQSVLCVLVNSYYELLGSFQSFDIYSENLHNILILFFTYLFIRLTQLIFKVKTKLSINLTSHAPWTFKLSDGKEYTATKSPFEVSVKPLSTTTYSLSEVKNICGTGTVSGSAKIEIFVLSSEEEKELNVEVFPVPSSEICHWKIETPQATTAFVLMYDVLGVTQYSQASSTRTQSHEGIIDLTNMKSGTYFLKLQAGEKSVVRKVVKY